jgi:hypothetical protein
MRSSKLPKRSGKWKQRIKCLRFDQFFNSYICNNYLNFCTLLAYVLWTQVVTQVVCVSRFRSSSLTGPVISRDSLPFHPHESAMDILDTPVEKRSSFYATLLSSTICSFRIFRFKECNLFFSSLVLSAPLLEQLLML